ncbi:hypothetical protein BC936DRAFT_139459 [Jimgerdemannia flammicorona]|uniref:Uncharacterized protein n=2 Tax=Jimgerdemannia flammicorona TaxID=994334 RepID=A0A433Q4P3_9FUNG|nr:hypothetical protein BC936DRAFT_139459 [Jimgerdemannia flammicorona]RUS24624.1 hypothetical protein BC938DRAFT_473308 [Jimgerdemannia flammicorona]
MDRLTQLQDAIDQTARIFFNSIHYLNSKAAMVPLNDSIPIIAPNMQADPPDLFQQNTRELATDLVKKAKEIDALVDALPGVKYTEEEQIKALEDLEKANALANEEHEAAVAHARSLLDQVSQALRTIADDQSQAAASVS